MLANDSLQPRGFRGTGEHWQELLPSTGRVVRLPVDGVRHGPFMSLPEGRFDAIVVETLSESLGDLERFVSQAASQLEPDGLLLIEIENVAAPRSLRVALEGRPGTLDPVGNLREPERRVNPRRVVEAAQDAGLLLEDLYRVPTGSTDVGPTFVESMFEQGFLALPYLGRVPANRLWLVARNALRLSGSVVIGPGSAAQVAHTRQSLSFLPDDWEIIESTGSVESTAFDHGVAESQGEILWFLRAGVRVDAKLFDNLRARVLLSPAAPGDGNVISYPGDPSGLMVDRGHVMLAGPISDRDYQCDPVRFEDWLMVLGSIAQAVHGVAGGYVHATPNVADIDSEVLGGETDRLLAGWSAVEQDASGSYSVTNPWSKQSPAPPPWQGRKPRLSLCMITKNEEEFLPQCLASVKDAVDEMVIVDTGSTDRTVEIARSFGAKVLFFDWVDNFAAARNVALREATGDWILSMDADEVVEDGGATRIRKLVEDATVAGYHLHFTNLYSGKKTIGVLMVRLFRNLPGVVWENAIHEQVTPSLTAAASEHGLVLSTTSVEVEHHGYLDEVMESRGKNDRNDRLFKLHLAASPDDVYMLYKYGDFLRRFPGRWEEAKEQLSQCLALLLRKPPAEVRTLPYASEVAALLVLELARSGQVADAEEILEQALARFAPTPNLHYLAASIALQQERSDQAIRHFRHCLNYRGQVLVVPIQDGITSYVSITGIARALWQKGNRVKATRLLHQARSLEPDYDVSALVLSQMHFEQGDPSKALDVLMEHLERNPEAAGVCQQASLFLAHLGLTDQARRMGERAVTLLENQNLDLEANKLRETLAAYAG